MAFLTQSNIKNIGRIAAGSSTANAFLYHRMQAAKDYQSFDIFLSHSYQDAEIVLGSKTYLEEKGLSVYVDWIMDPHMNRENVTSESAERIRKRMRQSKSLLYLATENAPKSKWMPWELGYYDGFNGNVAILPVLVAGTSAFQGQEYLGLYPIVEIDDQSYANKLKVRRSSAYRTEDLTQWMRTPHNVVYG